MVVLVGLAGAHRNALIIIADDAGRQLGHLGNPVVRGSSVAGWAASMREI